MSMKRVVGAAAVAASVGLSAMTQNAGFAYAVPLDPPCPNCNSGPGGWPQEPPTTTVAPNTEPRGGERSEPPSTQSSAAPSTQSSAAPSTQSSAAPSTQSTETQTTQSTAAPSTQSSTTASSAPSATASSTESTTASSTPSTDGVQHRKHHRVQHREHDGVQHTKQAVGCAEHPTASPALRSARRFRSGYCGNWRSHRCVCRLQHRGPRRAAAAAGARVRLE